MSDLSVIILSSLTLLLGIFASALASGMETGLYVLNKVRLSLRCSNANARAVRLEKNLENSGSMLASLLLANNIAHYVLTASSVMLLQRLGVEDIELISTAILTPFLFVFGEMVPKNLFRQAAEVLVYHYSYILNITVKLFRYTGLSLVLDMISRMVLHLLTRNRKIDAASALLPVSVRAYLAEGRAHGALSDTQQWMAHKVMELRGTTVADVMTPRRNVISLPEDCSRKQFAEVLKDHSFSRIPLWRKSSGNIVSVVNVCRYLSDTNSRKLPGDCATEAISIESGWEVSKALLELQRARQTMGLVRDSEGKFIGIITLKDIVEEIVGELQAW